MTPSDLDYREIPLTRNQVAKVDVFNFERLSAKKWCACRNKRSPTFYAGRNVPHLGRQVLLHMQREILGLAYGDKRRVDHVNGDTLDNRVANLRIATIVQNAQNSRMPSRNKSGYKGVCWNKEKRKWESQIRVNGRHVHLGYFTDPKIAHDAYRAAAVRCFVEFARAE